VAGLRVHAIDVRKHLGVVLIRLLLVAEDHGIDGGR